MSKELTEKWKNGKLEENWYYIHLKSQYFGNIDCITINYCDEDGCFEEYPDEDIAEVLAPVQSYEEYKEREHDKECLKLSRDKVVRLEAENNTLKEQLMEANGIIKGASHLTVKDKRNAIICELISPEINDYLKKWGVK